MRFAIPLLLAAGLAAGPTLARTWHIEPGGLGDAPTIQAALDASAIGDTIEVAAGNYDVNLQMRSRRVLRGTAGPLATVLDGMALESVIVCEYCEHGTVVEGFTLTNGRADLGSGLRVDSSALSFRNNILTNNNGATYGAGIYCTLCNEDNWACPDLMDTRFTHDWSGLQTLLG